jgi:MYXO-CTERM domain-containing protein
VFTKFEPLGDQVVASDPFGWTREDGRAEVFAIDTKGELVRTYRDDGGWTAWASLGGGDLNSCVPGGGPGAGSGGAGGGGGSSSGSGGQGGNGVSGGEDASCACRAAGSPASSSLPLAGWLAAAVVPFAALRRRERRERRGR